MPTDSKLLIATDLSARSDRPLERALLLGRQLGTPVIILHVLETCRELGAEEEQRLRTLLQEEFGLTGADAEICFEFGSVPFTVARVAEERGCSVIITGVARYNSPRDFFLGTAVDYLVRESRVPVLVVKRRARQPYDRLVVATDFSSAATHAIIAAAELIPDVPILLVHAYQASFEAFLEHDSTAPVIHSEAVQSMARLISELPASLRPRIDTIIEEGLFANALSKIINNPGCALLVLGTTSKRGHSHYLSSHDAWTLPTYQPSDVLLVREPAPTGKGSRKKARPA